MKRRSKISSGQRKGPRRKAVKRHTARKSRPNRSFSAPDLQEKLDQRTRELSEALERQTATSEVLRVISSSPGDLEPVFATILENATRICEANFGNVYLWDGDAFYLVAAHNTPRAFSDTRMREPFRPNAGHPFGSLVDTKQVFHVADIMKLPIYREGDPQMVEAVELGKMRTCLGVPMLKDDNLIGVVLVFRQEVREFAANQIALITNFAAQAVIAIENARLLGELRQRTNDLTERTTDLTEALEQQRATSKVLQVISNFPGDPEPVFASMLENAARVCEAKFGNIFRLDHDAIRPVAALAEPEALVEFFQHGPHRPHEDDPIMRVARTKQSIHVLDFTKELAYIERNPLAVAAAELGGIRTLLVVPMLKGDVLIGAIALYRQEVRRFSDKQIALVTNFAAQAVIAIENVRLLSELRESLEQQTATSEVLRVISSSPGELEPVFEIILEDATRICEAKFGIMQLIEGDGLRSVALHDVPSAYAEAMGHDPIFRPPVGHPLDRVVSTKQVVHIPDMRTEQKLRGRIVELAGARSLLTVPMLKENALIGVISIYRQEVRPFTDKQIELVKNFADQAVIAIENARLLSELRQRTEEVGKLNQQLEQRVADQVGEIERMGRLRRFLPPQVADLIVASGSEKQLESHRREITALFCDLRGFTGFTESADAEDVMALLRDYHAAIGQIVIKYNGTLERYAGDGVMVIFNDPVLLENPALQAVLMALEVRDAIGSLTEIWRRWGHEIGFGIGIAHGFATLGTIGFEGRFDYAAIGTVSNVASRLCDEAKPGQILISPRVLTKVENAVTVEPVGEFDLKGIRRPLAAYNVVAAQTKN
jgi:GAF domain-containing protein